MDHSLNNDERVDMEQTTDATVAEKEEEWCFGMVGKLLFLLCINLCTTV